MPHSPTPWPEPVYDNHGNGGFSEWWEIPSIAKVYTAADAEFILRAVNCHDELVQSLRAACELASTIPLGCDECEENPEHEADHDLAARIVDILRATLAKAEAK